ncbi:YhcN/YlaJ family sporulation lipoprotein [Numidum massiliense]|uniref:YhcN/YlaJ family sporulation lipoprotein n=1 Tax=Numidum massiliense TaxID=1522315 RepID=UPI00164E948A|nr:YhcN/YlaJ family sporulation lipoprotein [Numidum massiliense]
MISTVAVTVTISCVLTLTATGCTKTAPPKQGATTKGTQTKDKRTDKKRATMKQTEKKLQAEKKHTAQKHTVQKYTVHNFSHDNLSNVAEQIVKQDKRVTDATAVVRGDDLYTALKVTNFNRLRMKQIREKAHSKLRAQFPDHEIHVTTDNKLFLELQRINTEAKKKRQPKKKDLMKKLQKIHDGMKG